MDKDIQEMFSKKNREILIHNLELDIERNMDVLNDTLTNIFNLQFDIAIKNIFSIYDNDDLKQEITKILVLLKSKSFILLNNGINVKRDYLLEQIKKLEFEEKQMDAYYKMVFDTTNDTVSILDNEDVLLLIEKCINDLQNASLSDNELVNKRIDDYIYTRLFGKLKEKVCEEFLIRDNNLINKGKESYLKYQELEERTTNI